MVQPLKIAGLLTIVAASAMSATSADTERAITSFVSHSGQFELRLSSAVGTQPELWSLVDQRLGRVLYTIDESFTTKWVYVSDDGEHLCAVDDFCRGEPSLEHHVLRFYNQGRETRTYSLGDLVPSPRYVTTTASHWLWIASTLPGSRISTPEHVASDGTFSLTTLDLNVHKFDLATGRRLDVRCSPLMPSGAVGVFGTIRLVTPAISGVTARRFAVLSGCPLCGAILPNTDMTFEVPDGFVAPFLLEWLTDDSLLPNTDHWATIFIREGQLVGALSHVVNRCH